MTKDKINRKIRLRRTLLGLCFSIICIVIAIFIILKSDYFVIKNVSVQNNLFVTKEEITLLSDLKGKNIFLIDKNKVSQKILINPYIDKVFIKRKLPSTVILDVTEKKIKGIIKYRNGFINVDGDGKMVQVVNRFPNGKIPFILGVTASQYLPDQYIIQNDDIKREALKAILTIADYNESKYYFYSIDINDPYNIQLVTNSGYRVKIGDWTNVEYKIALTISILKNPSISSSKGYLQLQPDGSAIFKNN